MPESPLKDASVESLTRLHDLAMNLGGISELQPALQAILDTLVEAEGAHFGLVWLHEAETGALRARASHGFTGAALRHFESVMPGPGGGAAGNAFAQGRRWAVEDTERDASFAPFREAAREAGFRAVHSTPIANRSGELLGVLSVHFRDARSLAQQDVQMADVCAHYAAGAIETWRREEALRRSADELRELDQRKDEFLATLAHELRNPLAPLRNGLEVLRLAGGNAQLAEKARAMMERQLQQMVRLVDDLLDVSRVSRGRIELRCGDVELAGVLRNAIETSQPLMAERGHRFSARIPDEKIVVFADVTRLSQVFGNLLNNAAKYTERGGRIELDMKLLGGTVVISVRDDGIGIPADMLARVFDIFTQVDRSLEKSQGGLGIGLSIAKRLVEMHGGTIEVHSGGHRRGSEFIVRLPARVEVRESEAPPPAAARPVRAGPARRILVADDNLDTAATLSLMLEMLGNDVRIARDGVEAVQMAERFRPDVVMLDIGMPKLNGYDACSRLRRQRGGEEAFIVALTGWAQDEDRRRCLAAGFDRHLVKPVEPAEIEGMLKALPLPR